MRRESRSIFRQLNRSRMMAKERPAPSTPPLRPRALYEKTKELPIPEIMENTVRDKEICLAEELDTDQVWYVDSLFPTRDSSPPVPADLSYLSSKSAEAITAGLLSMQKHHRLET